MISNDKVAEIFFSIDEFCKVFEPAYTQKLIDDSKRQRKRPSRCRWQRGPAFCWSSTLAPTVPLEIVEFVITQANVVDDRAPLREGNFLKKIFGSLYGDKSYLSKELALILFEGGVHLVMGIRSNKERIYNHARQNPYCAKGR